MKYTFCRAQSGPNAPGTGGNANTIQICILVLLYALDSRWHCLAFLLLLLDCMQAGEGGGGEPAAVVGGKYSDVIEAVTRWQVMSERGGEGEREGGEISLWAAESELDFKPGLVGLGTYVYCGKMSI